MFFLYTAKWCDLDLFLFLVYLMISYHNATTQPLDTQNIYDIVPSLFWLKTCHFLSPTFLVSYKPATMRSCNFRNGVNWSWIWSPFHFSLSLQPQGPILGPWLFLLYINDMPQAIDCDLFLYADNTCLL